jgi:hypothetical protein
MFEVTKDNYHMFLTHHGMDPVCAEWVVAAHDNTENYHNLLSVKLWVDASKIVIEKNRE